MEYKEDEKSTDSVTQCYNMHNMTHLRLTL